MQTASSVLGFGFVFRLTAVRVVFIGPTACQSSLHSSNCVTKSLSNFVGNYARQEKIFVQFYKKKLSGFCLIKFEVDDVARIDLICIDKKFTNKGLAKDLLKYSLYSLKKISKNRIIVSTQNDNVFAIKLYESMKFSKKDTNYLYHYIS